MSSLLSDSLPSSALVATTAVATVAFLALAKLSLWPSRPRVLHNPLKTGASDELNVYQPDAFPGARDVDTPVSLTVEAWISFGGAAVLMDRVVWNYSCV